jgi:hypothetical protein
MNFRNCKRKWKKIKNGAQWWATLSAQGQALLAQSNGESSLANPLQLVWQWVHTWRRGTCWWAARRGGVRWPVGHRKVWGHPPGMGSGAGAHRQGSAMVGWKRGWRGGASSMSAGSGDRLWPSGEPKRVSVEVVLARFQCDGVFRWSMADEREGGW